MNFFESFITLTGYKRFPWQEALYKRFESADIPECCNLPTGLGKTNVIAIWLIALANELNVPRRLVYVVNRRTVVDQTTNEAIKLRDNAKNIGIENLRISTLRGQFADNREWSADPSQPAIICGTVDMIGSRLLFSGYGAGFKTRPLFAGFLGQDALLIHDEAHLEPAFQELIDAIVSEQERERKNKENLSWLGLRVMQLTATGRNGKDDPPFSLTPDDHTHSEVKKRIESHKQLRLISVDAENKIPSEIVKAAEVYKDENAAVIVFARTVKDVLTIEKELKKKTKKKTVLLTGTMRGKERDELVETAEFKRFLKDSDPGETVYLICTSAGEVGIDISADHMVCDLTPFDSMAQRLGRVNRYGNVEAKIDVVHPQSFGKLDEKTKEIKANEYDKQRLKTLELIQKLPPKKNQFDASPLALNGLDAHEKTDAFTPTPTILPVTDILFDAWSLTTIRGKMPGRPPVEPYLHGISEWQPPETHVAWRDEVEIITDDLIERYPPADLLDDFPLKPHELLRDQSDRIAESLLTLAKSNTDTLFWIVGAQNEVTITTIEELTEGKKKDSEKIKAIKNKISHAMLLLPPCMGGLTELGTLDGATERKEDTHYDVSNDWLNEKDEKRRERKWSASRKAEPPNGMRLLRMIDIKPDADEWDADDNDSSTKRFWHWYIRPRSSDDDLTKTSSVLVSLDSHTSQVETIATDIVNRLALPDGLKEAVILAAKWHDVGKEREIWQRSIGNPNPKVPYAKSGKKWIGLNSCPNYRHEFGSLLDVQNPEKEFHRELYQLSDEMQDVVLHLIAAHHGYARPNFAMENSYDPEYSADQSTSVSIEAMRRFAHLQRKYGRWGLAYLESLLRAADYAASANPSESVDETEKQEVPS